MYTLLPNRRFSKPALVWLLVCAGLLIDVGCGSGSGSSGGVTVGASAGELVATPNPVGFGNVAIGSSATQTVALSNPGSGPTTISNASASGQGFSISGLTTPATLAAGKIITFNVTFAPTTGGPLSGSVTLANTGSSATLTIPLSGTGASGGTSGGQLVATPSSVTFSTSVMVGNTATQSVTLSNPGTGTTTVNSVSVTGQDFAFNLVTPVNIPAGQTTAFNVIFAPSTAGTLTSTLSLYNSTAVSPLVINLSGTGTTVVPSAHSVDLSWTAGGSTIDGYNIYRSTAPGGPYTTLVNSSGLIPSTTTTFTDNTVVSGITYFYVARAVANGVESANSNEAQAMIPTP